MPAGVGALCCGSFGQGSGPVHMSSVVCSGSEPNITNCSYSATSSGHQRDVGVRCQPRTISGTVCISTFPIILYCTSIHIYLLTERPGNIRLVGGPNAWEGRVEIYLSGTWGTVSNDVSYDYRTETASVVCRQLGYSGGKLVCFVCLHSNLHNE